MTATDFCRQCGGLGGETACRERFDALLALDHSRQDPWGPRHGLAVAVYTLQHPAGVGRERLERSWLIAHRCVVSGDDAWRLARALASRVRVRLSDWGVPGLPTMPGSGSYRVTIQDLGDFGSSGYPDDLMSWARATIDRWQRGGAGPSLSKPVEHPVQTEKHEQPEVDRDTHLGRRPTGGAQDERGEH